MENGATAVIKDDVVEEEQVRAAVDAVVAQHAKLDVLVYNNNNAEGGRCSILDDTATEKDLDLGSLSGAFYGGQQAARVMMPRKRGCILYFSTTTTAGACSSRDVMVSRYGLVGLVRNLSAELGPHGVRVNCISGDGVDADSVAKAALYLASDDANYVSGHNIVLNPDKIDPIHHLT
ncbi:uncharacterized protein [Phyllobates terribilis]|uniref:uncharacterized protein n=1 Tax=Phyllobates terribilis TaxID=111132 RepID=UPI003CCACF8E